MSEYDDIYYTVKGDLRLYARDYNRASSSTVLLCLHGLSRNSADFEPMAKYFSDDYRMICVDQRGRGLSQWDEDASRYQLPFYVEDMWQLLDQQNIEKVVVIGTSMGGLMGMLMASQRPESIQGLVVNDVGPEVSPEGLARIMGYVGKPVEISSWDDAIDYVESINKVCFPQFSRSQWQAMARRTYRENGQGIPIANYDPNISTPIKADDSAAVPNDLWSVFEMLSVPILTLRGALSDLFSEECLHRMEQCQPTMLSAEIDTVGHAPVLDEPQAVMHIGRFLKSLSL